MSFEKHDSERNNDTIDLKSRQDDKELISDDMNIKLHLNESLDLKGITVSEDLIHKTLSAIKQSETEQQDQQQDNKSNDEMASKRTIPWGRYVRKIAGAAAAVLVVTVGLSFAIKDSVMKDNMEQESAEMEAADDTSLYGTADASGSTAFETAPSSEDESAQALAKDETDTSTTPESVMAITDSVGDENDSQRTFAGIADDTGNTEQTQITGAVKSNNGQEYLTFEGITLTDSEMVKTVKIINQTNSTEIVLTEQSDILNFFAVMEQQLFTVGTTAPSSQNYTVEIVGLQTADVLYTIIIGDSISVSINTGDTVDQIYYNTEDNALLIQNLDEFYQSYN